ncbi:MAG: hypothetical protein MZV70_01300 [Desulfobacterales bacterium]|nr:hypothetical protein [Desulfobacterales bacterium]
MHGRHHEIDGGRQVTVVNGRDLPAISRKFRAGSSRSTAADPLDARRVTLPPKHARSRTPDPLPSKSP